ncbi:MAG: Ldh family oxidoreductase [Cyclobacteriaceae bacterium]
MEKLFKEDVLKQFCKEVFVYMGCSENDAKLSSDVLISADLRGVDSHGVARLSGYFRLWENDRINTKPEIKTIWETPSTASIDADRALGLVSSPFAMDIAIKKAKDVGTGWVSVQNSNHFGIAAYHAMRALKEDMIGIALTNASALVSPTFSKDRLLGTNPICVVIPANKENAFVADMATTTAANGKLEILQRKKINAPDGWMQDKNGNPSIDPFELKNGGAMLPLGGDRIHGSHKGYALGAIVDIFSAILSGANYGPWVPPFVSFLPVPENPVGKGIGHFFGAMRIDAFRAPDEFKNHMDNWIRTFKNSSRIDENQEVIIPGEPEIALEKERKEKGIPLLDKVIEDLKVISAKSKVAFPD